ncbi:membrane protein insertion efficiency factor YidD [bacterium]|nr:membrane protein insertion efficiency factor YidD [candidate division CSSED10-310 bacterium]
MFFLYGSLYGRTKGDSCLFYPSCSHFSRFAIKKYGVITGLSMTAGRLIRAHTNFDGFYPEVVVNEGKRFLDLPQHQHFEYYILFSAEDFIHVNASHP